jgi:two-component system cell cycle sensor histidine kinase/response regulator CckA
VVEPPAVLASAAYVFGAKHGGGASIWQRALPPALVLIAGLEAATAASKIWWGVMPVSLTGVYIAGVPAVLVLQIAAVSNRIQQALRRARDELGQRVEERTAELAKSVGELEAQIAERHAVEQALRESEERYRILSELSSDFGFALRMDRDHRVQFDWASDAIRRVTGYEAQELNGSGWLSLTRTEDREGALARFDAALAGKAPDAEVPIVTKQGELRWVHFVADTLSSDEDGVTRIVCTGRDITERKRAEQEKRRLELHMREVQRLESLGLLAGGVAHDFNNMLAVIRGNIRLARADLQSGASPERRLDRIQSAQEHAAALTEQVLTYAGKAAVKLRPLDLSRLTQEMLSLLEASLVEKGALELDLAEDLPAIEGDVTQMRQVILNLVANASEALGEGDGKVRVRTRLLVAEPLLLSDSFGAPEPAAGEYVALEVSDTGEGIAPALRARVFEPFFTSKPSGSGLGLAAVLGIVSAHRGVIRVADEPGGGALFQVLIPPSARRAESMHEAREPAARASEGSTILIVEDEPAVLELAQEFLERSGFEVLAAPGGREGVEIFRAHNGEVDAVVLDVVMPEESSEEAFLEIRRIRPDVPVVLMSGYDKVNALDGFAAGGISSFLRKPFEPEELVQSVCDAMASAPPAVAREPSPGR